MWTDPAHSLRHVHLAATVGAASHADPAKGLIRFAATVALPLQHAKFENRLAQSALVFVSTINNI